ncbi:hypothetical protein HYH02_001206 [Chlamydomonas schloesseri]|uniref:ABC transporter domain-containing protein n=1 Tax=Chlamydomonas schloesseri TaxID=2026947 RepID=A0A835WX18_9CHLO|nr:hypothetical protein HYH02_001206 [Chlamydomonas schloesseri]|eukprot:KAG2454171.1 hypothetical protein HYH02_001206 [Chlamydomonas schloesseri]
MADPSTKAKGLARVRSRADVNEAINAVTDGDKGPQRLFERLNERLGRVGITLPGVEVRWENLRVEVMAPQTQQQSKAAVAPHRGAADASKAGTGACTVGGKKLPLPLPSHRRARRQVILDAGSGVLRPGRMTLLLGPPGAGRSTLLKALAGQLIPPSAAPVPGGPKCSSSSRSAAAADGGAGLVPVRTAGGLKQYGTIKYNGLPMQGDNGSKPAFDVARVATYVSQTENHLPELTVAETLTFAAQCQGSDLVPRLYELLRSREAAAGLSGAEEEDADLARLLELARGPDAPLLMAQHTARMLEIDHVMDTVVGNELLKGISGGQKRRVTAGEMVVGAAQVLMLDEITNGLDAASALTICKALRSTCEQTNATIVATLLQPSPEVVACFHDVILVSQGVVAYHGPTERLAPFLGSLGLAANAEAGQTMADFAQEVLSSPEDQAKYRLPQPPPPAPQLAWQGLKWISPRRMRQAFAANEAGRDAAKQDLVLHTRPQSLKQRGAVWAAVVRRETTLLLRNPAFFMAGLMQILLSAFLVSTAFVNLDRSNTDGANLTMSVMFFSLMSLFFGGFNFAPIYCARLRVFFKQRDHGFYSPLAHAVSSVLLRIPETLINSAAFSVMVYSSVGLTMDAGRFFIFLLNLIAMGIQSVTTFQLLGALTRNDVATQGLGGVLLMINVLLSGFPIARTSIPGWWIWGYWLSPMSWSLRSMLVSEMTSDEWPLANLADPTGPTVGEDAMAMRGFQTEWFWVWAGIGYVLGIALLQLVAQVLALTFLGPPENKTAPEHEEDEEDAHLLHNATPFWNAASALGQALGHASRRLSGVYGQTAATEGPSQYDASQYDVSQYGVSQYDASQYSRESGEDRNSAASSAGANGLPSPATVELTQQPQVQPQKQQQRQPDHAVMVVSAGGSSSGSGSSQRAGQGNSGGGDAAAALGGEMSFKPVVMAFKDVSYFVPHPDKGNQKGKELQLLNGVSGVFRPGVLTSLMGASGAGKTTLMDVLAGRKTGGRAEGLQLVNGQPKRMSTFARVMGYVEQLDVHNPQATVEEALMFSAALRVEPAAFAAAAVAGSAAATDTAAARKDFVRRMMDVVELGPLADRRIGLGGAGGGLSTEARKRLTIAVELVANPSIVFMDEPTSGLDARAAGVVMRAVRNTVATGRTVVCTIHQPNREIMDYFDELLLLRPGGRTIFFGALGSRQSALVSYLSNVVPGIPHYEPHMNPANWMLEVTAPSAAAALGVDFADLWEKSEQCRSATALIEHYTSGATAASSRITAGDIEAGPAAGTISAAATNETAAEHRFARSPLVQLGLVARRNLTSQMRNVEYNGMRFATAFVLAWVLGSLYWDRGTKTGTLVGVMDILGVLFASSLFLPLNNMLLVMPVVAADRAVYYREKASGMYGGAVFAAAQAIAEMPFLFVQSVLFVVIVYTTVHFEFNSAKAMWFWLYMWLETMFFTFFGIAAMNLAPVMPTAIAGSSGLIMLWNLFCGFLISRPNMKPWYLWAYYANPPTWTIYGTAVTQLGDLTDTFIQLPGGETTSVANYIKGAFSYDYDMRGWIVLIMIGFIVACRVAAYYGLIRLNFQKR